MIADLISDMVCSLGYVVSGTANTLSLARRELCKRNFDAVLLDIGIDGQHGPEIADQLLEMKVPFGFVTGYDGPFEGRHAQVPLLLKPFTTVELGNLLEKLAAPARAREKLADVFENSYKPTARSQCRSSYRQDSSSARMLRQSLGG